MRSENSGVGETSSIDAAMGGDSCPEQQYSLRWNDFHASILSSFRHLRDEEDFVDVTLACDGCSFTAHKVVLSACSPYFRKLLKANPCQHPIVILRDVQQKDMESLLRFMYNGEVHIGQEQLADFLKTAQMLQVRGLADVPMGAQGQRLVTAPDQKISPNSTSLPWATDIQSPRGRDSGSPPPLKRSRSSEVPSRGYSPERARSPSRGNGAEMRESLLGQALEGGPTIHTNSSNQKGNSDSSLQAQSTGEDSNSSSTALSDRGGPVTPKTEPSDYPMLDDHPLLSTNGAGPGAGMMDQARTFPGALLGLQGLPGLLPGPSGMHNNGPDSFDYQRRPRERSSQAVNRHRNRSSVTASKRTSAMTTTSSSSCFNYSAQQYDANRNVNANTNTNIVNTNGSDGFECPLCEVHQASLIDMRQHLDMHYPRDSSICPVFQCARRFTHPNSVRNHMRIKHTTQWVKIKNYRWR